jgi:transglutaminase superfamily protein
VVISLLSWHYSKSPLYVTKTAARALVLNSLVLVVSIHDSFAAIHKTPVGPPLHEIGRRSITRDAFLSSIRTLFPHKIINVIIFENKPIIRSSYKFGYQSVSDSRICRLKDKYGIDRLFPTGSDFIGIIALMNWVNSQWHHGTTGATEFDPGKFEADRILSHAKHGDQFWCHVAAMTFIQLASSVGIQARLISLSQDGYNPDHAVAEVWSNEKQKWFMVDTDFNIWYTRNGVPLNVLEIHNLMMSNETNQIQIQKGINRLTPEYEKRIPVLYKFYRYFDVDMRNDWLTNQYFPGHPARSDKATLFWRDDRSPPVLNLKTKISSPLDLYWDLNRTELILSSLSPGKMTVAVDIATHTPNFSHFEVEFDSYEICKVTSNRIVWPLHLGGNSLKVCSVNSLGQKGIPAIVEVQIGL